MSDNNTLIPVSEMTEATLPKFKENLFPPNLTQKEQDSIKIAFISKFGFRQWRDLIGRTASRAK
jgi:hypothetical protein